MSLSDSELAQLYDRYAHVVFARCLSILGNEEDARDAVQETFARVLRHGDTFREESSPLTWMYRISTNHCLNVIRNRKAHVSKHEVNREAIVGEGFSRPPDRDAFDDEVIRKLLGEADDETRRCVVHTFFDDCTREEVAKLVGISVPTVHKRLNGFLERARRVLKVPVPTVVAILLAIRWDAILTSAGSAP